MNNEVTVPQTPQEAFQQKIQDRLREDVGSLIPDEVIAEMTKKAINDMFFTRRGSVDAYGRPQIKELSWFEKEVEEQTRAKVRQALSDYMKENGKELVKNAADAIAKKAPEILATFLIEGIVNSATGYSYSLTDTLRAILQGKPL